MPVTVPVGAVIMITLEMVVDQQQCLMTFPYRLDDEAINWPDDAATISGRFDTQIVEPIMNNVSKNISFPTILVQPIQPQRLRAVRNDSLHAGGRDAPPLPTGAAVVVRRQGIEAGRSNQGRIYIPGFTPDQVQNSQLTAAALGQTGGITQGILDVLEPVGVNFTLTPIVWASPSGDTTREVFITQIDPIIRYQRRREIGVGI